MGEKRSRPASARLHSRLQEHEDCKGDLRMAGRGQSADRDSACKCRRFPQQERASEHHSSGHQGGTRDRYRRELRETKFGGCDSRWTLWARRIGLPTGKGDRSIPKASRNWRRNWNDRCIRRGATCAAS